MFIKNLTIRNFRSIKELTINPKNLCALIGPNSAGKTNILKALDLILGEGWTTKAKVAKELFNDCSKPIFIKLDLREGVEWNYYSQTKIINTITLEMNLEPLSCEVRIWTDYPNDKQGEGYYMNEEFKKTCHFIFIPSERQLISELKMGQWTMLGKLMRLVYENYAKYVGDEQLLKTQFAEKIKPAKEFLENDFSTDDITFKKFVDTFKQYCKENSAGLANEFEPILDIYNLNWFYKTLQIHVKEDFPNKDFDSEDVGAGMQNLLLISIFQTYAELMGGRVIFGIEEPEIYLYPSAQRSLYRNIIKLSENTQIFYTTHNPNFVDATRPDDITLLRKNLENGTYILEKDNSLSNENIENEKHKIYTHFNPERNELFFAQKVLFVEGDSDKILFSTLCEKRWNIDLDEKGISIISCGGKGGVLYFLGVCKLIGYSDYFAVWDADEDLDNQSLLDVTKNEHKGLEIVDNLEKLLNLPSGNDAQKVKNAYEWAIKEDNQIPEDFSVVEAFLNTNSLISSTQVVLETNPSENTEPDDIPF
jgi:predicted ATP-dependent endonuclease of OLD family